MFTTNQARPPSILESPSLPFDPGKKMDLSSVAEPEQWEVSTDTILRVFKTQLSSYFCLQDRRKLRVALREGNVTAIVGLVRKNSLMICKDKKNIFNPFIRPTKLLKTLVAVLTTNERVSFPFWRVHIEALSKRWSLPIKTDSAGSDLNSCSGSSPYTGSNSLFSKRIISHPIKNSQKIFSASFRYLPVEQMVKENIQKEKIKQAQKKRVKRVIRQNKPMCKFIQRKRVAGKYVGKLCGNVLVNDEDNCPEHKNKTSPSLELYPYTCDFVISQKQGKDRARARKGLECGLLCDEGKRRCKTHLKSDNHPINPEDCAILRFTDEDGSEHDSLIMPPKKDVETVIRCFKVRARLNKSQIKKYTQHTGDCRKTWNLLTARQEDLGKDPKQAKLRAGLVDKLPEELSYLTNTPKDCRDSVLEDFCDSVKNMHSKYENKLKRERERKEWCETNNRKYTERKVKKPIINFRTKKQDQVLSIAKSAVTLLPTGIKIYPTYYGKEPVRLNNRAVKKAGRKAHDRKYEQIFQSGLKHDIKLIKTKSKKFYFAIPYDIHKQNTPKTKEFGSGDPGVKTFLTTFNSEGECVSYGDLCDVKIRKIHAKIDILKRLLSFYRNQEIIHKVEELRVAINTLEEHLKNKVTNLHYSVIKELKEFRLFYMPHFQNKQMERLKSTRRNTKREMNCLSHYRFSQRLKAKAEEVGSEVYVSDEYRTTITCSSCLRKNYVGFSREFRCRYCNFEWFRDANASRNNVLKYLF